MVDGSAIKTSRIITQRLLKRLSQLEKVEKTESRIKVVISVGASEQKAKNRYVNVVVIAGNTENKPFR